MVKRATAEPITADDVEIALRSHFAAPKFAVITGVRNAPGWDANRTCDMLAIGVWNSAGHDLHGVEIKANRGDWLREIQDPTKAEAFARYCDWWWVAAPPGVVKVEEVPVAWGVMEVVGGGIRIRRPGTKRVPVEPIERDFLACITRRVVEQTPAEGVLSAAVKKARAEGRDEGKRQAEKRDEVGERYVEREGAKALRIVQEFQEKCGVYLGEWNPSARVEQFKRFLAADEPLERARKKLESIRDAVTSALGETTPPRLPFGDVT